jgi:polysaccharide pyruvyl transferase CsaB
LKLVIAGYYGCGNLGDDALLCGLVERLGDRHQIVALSGNPSNTTETFGIEAIARKNIAGATQAIRSCDALIFGGGGLLQDITSLLSLKYYTHLISVATKADKRIALLGQGVGPINSFLGKRAVAKAFRTCDLITVRDEESLKAVNALAGSSAATIAMTDDLAWLLNPPSVVTRSRSIAVAARPWKQQTAKIVREFADFCQRAVSAGWDIMPTSFDRAMDDAVLDQIFPNATTEIYEQDPRSVLSSLASVGGTVALRLHAGILTTISGICPTMVAYDNKVRAFARSIQQEALSLENLTGERLWLAFTEKQADADRWAETALDRRGLGKARAYENIQMLEELLRYGRVSRSV